MNTIPDLSRHKAACYFIRIPEAGKNTTQLAIAFQHGLAFEEFVRNDLAKVGFKFREPDFDKAMVAASGDPATGPVLSDEVMTALATAFREIDQVEYDPEIHWRDLTNMKNVVDLTPHRLVGHNVFGKPVHDVDGVRVVAQSPALQTREDDTASQQAPPVFLRAVDPKSLLRCAEAWVKSVGDGRFHPDDAVRLEAYARDVSTEVFPVDVASMTDAIGRASSLLVARNKGTLNAAFTQAMGNGTAGARSAFGVALRRMIGTGPAVTDRTVSFRGAVDAAALVGFDRSTALDLDGDLALDGEALARNLAEPGASGPDHLVRVAVNAAQVKAAEKELGRRAADGVAVIAVPTGTKDLADLRDRIAMAYDFAAEAEVPAEVTGSKPMSVMLVGDRRPTPDPGALPPLVDRVSNSADLWSWTARATMELTPDGARTAAADVEVVQGSGTANKWQSPYRSLTAVGETTKMVPRNLDGAVKRALERVGAAHPDVLGWLGEEYGYTTAELIEIFSPEQLDAMALKAHADERGRGFLLADQTGVGKGRTQAAFMRRDVLKGRRPIYLNKSVSQLDDLMRDIVATKSEGILVPALLNSNGSLRNPKTKETMAEATPVDADWVVEGRWPEGSTLVLASYAQFNRAVDDENTSVKAAWLESVAKRGGLTLRADECQEAASQTSNTHQNLTAAMEHMEDVTYASSTPFRGVGQFGFFRSLLPEGVLPAHVAQMIQKGGDAFAETLSSMLVADGVMVRREFDVRDVEVELVVDKENYPRNRETMDAFAKAFGAINRLSVRAGEAARANRARRATIAPLLDTALRVTVAATLYDCVMAKALRALREEGGKPVLLVDNTLESFFEELAESGEAPTLKAYMARILDRTTVAKTKEGEPIKLLDAVIGEGGQGLQEAYAEAAAAVEGLPELGLDLIDRALKGFEEAGFTCGEVTGRSLKMEDGQVVRRARPRDKDEVDAFNDGVYDAILINGTAATGTSLHSGREFLDQRRRHFLEWQPPEDVIARVQAGGRTMRHDQVCLPLFNQFHTGTPAQTLKSAALNAKLRGQSASTTSNRDAVMVMRGVPDLCNPVGDAVLSRLAASRPELLERMGLVVEEVDTQAKRLLAQDDKAINSYADSLSESARHRRDAKEKTGDVRRVGDLKRSASDIMFRLQGLPVDVQERFCQEATAEFTATLEELEAMGENPLNTSELPGEFVPTDETVFEPGLPGSDSAFHSDIRLVKGYLRRPGKGMMPDEVIELVEIGEAGARRSVECARRIRDDMHDHLEEYVPAGQPGVAEALAAGSKQVVERKARLDRLADTLDTVVPGKRIQVTVGGEPKSAIVTRIEHPPMGYEHVPGRYGVDYVVFGEERVRSYRLDTLIRDKAARTGEKWNVTDGLTGEDAPTVKSEIEAAAKSSVSSCSILVGNVYKAMELNAELRLGRLCTVRTEAGVLERGLVMSGRARKLDAMPIHLSDAKVASDAICKMGVEVFASPNLKDKSLHLVAGQADVTLTLPSLKSRTWGLVYDSPLMRRLAEQGQPGPRNGVVVHLMPTQVPEAVQALMEAGVRLYTSPGNRDLVDRVRPESEDAPQPAGALAA